MNPLKQVDILIKRYPELAYQRDNIIAAYNIMEKSYSNKGKLLIAGNGGSAADAEHIVGELMKGFENPRKLDKDYIKRMEAKVNDVTSDFTKRAVEAEKTSNWELKVGNLDTKRAIMDQRDLVKGLMLLAEKGKAGDVYNISSEYVYQMSDIVKMIEKQVGHKLEIKIDEKLIRPTDEKIIVGDITKLKEDTGWYQDIRMEQTISDMLDYWRKIL